MLVVHPTSSCDVCLEPYGNGPKSPHSITCGHVFCLGCLEAITSGACPLCRERFHPMDTRRLHIDLDCQGVMSPYKSVTDESLQQARVLQDSIARIVKDGSSEAHLRELIEQCAAFLKTQERGQHEDLRVSFRMISYLCDVKSGLKKQLENSTKLAQEHEALRAQLATELAAAETRYQELLQTSTDERETALAVESSLREHYKQVLMRCEEAEIECDRLSREIENLRTDPLNALKTHPQDEPLHKPDVPFPTDDDMLAAMTKAKLLDKPEKEKIYLSPLPECLGPLSSSLKSFVALPEVDYDCEKTKIPEELDEEVDGDDNNDDDDEEEEEEEDDDDYEDKLPHSRIPDLIISIPDSLHLANEPLLQSKPAILRSITEPISTATSVLSLTAPTGSDAHNHEPSRPTQRLPALQIITHRSSCHSSPSPFNPPSSATYPQRPSQTIPKRNSYMRDRGRSFVSAQNEPEQLRSQLHDLLSNPVSSSLPNINHFPSIVTVPTHPSTPSSRSSSSGSLRCSTLRSPVSIKRPPATTITPPLPPTHNSHGAVTLQRPAMSTASSAALALEKERRKVEQERQKERERQNAERNQQRHLGTSASLNPLREPGNLHFMSSIQSSGTRRDLTNIYGTSTISGSSNSLRETFDSAHGLSHVNGTSSLRETGVYTGTQLRRQQSAVHGKRRINLQGLFT